MEIEIININELSPYENNSRTHSDTQIDLIISSIKEFGFTNPVLIDKYNGIIAGHGRVTAAKKAGLEQVPCIRLSDLTEDKKRAYVIADNQIALLSEWDEKLLSLELSDLSDMDFNLELTGFSLDEINSMLLEEIDSYSGLTDEDEVQDPPFHPVTKLGDIWLCGNHRVMCGDSTSIDAVKKLIDGHKVDMVFTDPPYGVSIVNVKRAEKVGGGGVPNFGKVGGGCVSNFGKVGGGFVDAKNYAEIIGDNTTDTARDFYSTCVSFGLDNFIIWGGNYFTDFLAPSPCWIVWDKQNTGNFADVELAWCSSTKSAKLYSFTWNGMSREGDRKTELLTRVHPTQKPVGLFLKIFDDFNFKSCFDGFLGSGSTLIAAEKTNKICYGIEMSPNYCDVIVNRWQNYTGKLATLESTGELFNNLANKCDMEIING